MTAPVEPAASRTRWPWRVAPLVVFAVAVVLAGWAIADQRAEIGAALHDVVWWALLLSLASCVVGLLCIFRAWAALVEDTGEHLTIRQALRIYGVGQLGKYMPGGVWSVAMQAQMVRQYGGSRKRVGSASLVILLLGVAVSLTMGSVLLPFSGHEARDRFWFTPFLALGTSLLILPPVLNRVSGLLGRLLRQTTGAPSYSVRGVLTASGWLVLGNVFFGLHVQVIGYGLGVTGARGFLLATAAYCLAVSLGLLFVPAPAGAGVRELVITLVLAPTLSTGGALVVALAARVVAIAADFTLALSQLISRGRQGGSPVFLSRRYPPSVGGMETLAAGVWRSIHESRPDAILIAHGGSNRSLVWWLPLAWFRLAWLVVMGKVEVVLVGDAPTYAVMEPLLRLARVPRATMVLGLDVSYPNRAYRAMVLPALRRAPNVIAISDATRDATVAVGVPPEHVSVVRLGVDIVACSAADRVRAAAAIRERVGLGSSDLVLLTLGRLVERKGSRWFVANVLAYLPENVHYVVAGSGPEAQPIIAAGAAAGVADRLHVLGRVDDSERENLLRGADLFIQPNVPVVGDMEGFGLVTVEAAVRGTLVVASDLEGIKDAVLDGRTGRLLPPGDAETWRLTLADLVADSDRLRDLGQRYAAEARGLFGQDQMAEAICDALGVDAAEVMSHAPGPDLSGT